MEAQVFSVYFRGFAEDISHETLKNIFSQYGRVLRLFIHKNRSYGIVEYDNISSCTDAIHNLKDKPPMNLYINMARNQPVDRKEKHNNTSMSYQENHDVNDTIKFEQDIYYVDETGTPITFLTDSATGDVYVPLRYATNIKSVVKRIPIVNGISNNDNLYQDDDCASQHSNNSISRKIKMHDDSIQIELENNNSSQSKFKKSFNYKRPNETFNRRTSNNYIRDSEPVQGTSNSQFNGNQNFRQQNNFHQQNSFHQTPTENKFHNKRFNKPYSRSHENDKISDFGKLKSNEEDNWVNSSTSMATDASTSNNTSFNISKHNASVQPSTSNIKKCSISDRLKPKTNNPVIFKTMELPENTYTKVSVETTINESTGWVQICDQLSQFKDLMYSVVQHMQTASSIQPEVGKMCLAKYGDKWQRAIVLSTSPKITVRFIDFGNESSVNDVIYDLSPELSEIPGFAICINLADGAPCKIKNPLIINVKPVKVEKNMIVVQVENGIYENETVTTPIDILTFAQKAMLSKLRDEMSGTLDRTIKLSDNKFVAAFLPNELGDDLATLSEINPVSNPSFQPKVGDFICAETKNDGWARGYLLKVDQKMKKYEVAFIDFGTVETVSEVTLIPEEFKKIPQFSCVCTADKISDKINDMVEFKIKKLTDNKIICEVEQCGEVTCVLWNPKEHGYNEPAPVSEAESSVSLNSSINNSIKTSDVPQKILLKNGDDVKLIDVTNNELCLRTKQAFEVVKRVEKYMNQFGAKAPALTEKPFVGQYVSAQYENIWYRAVVTKVNTNNSVEILYIDYGNDEIKPFISLKQLNEEMLKEPQSIMKAKLRNFTDKSFNTKCLLFLENLAQNKSIMKVSFLNSPETGIDLTMKDGTNINDELMKLDKNSQPSRANSSAPEPEQTELYKQVKVPGKNDPRITEVETENIPIGPANVKYLCDANLSAGFICVCLDRPEIMHKVHVELLNQMTKYVNHFVPNDSYAPESEEIVLAQNADKWYRGLCVQVENDTYSIFFIDYGFNKDLTTQEIRRIPREFLDEVQALANFAIIDGIPEEPSQNLIDRLETLFEKNETYEANVLKVEEGNYYISFPKILNILKSEKLM